MADYTSFENTTKRLIRKYGGSIALHHIEQPLREAATNRPYWNIDGATSYTPPTATVYDGYAILRKPRVSELAGSAILETDTVFMIVDTVQPSIGDTIHLGSAVYRVNEVFLISPDGSSEIMYKVYARK